MTHQLFAIGPAGCYISPMPDRTPKDIAPIVGEKIKARREALGWTQAEAAKKCGLSPGYWPQLEQGARMPTINRLADIARVMRCKLADLLP